MQLSFFQKCAVLVDCPEPLKRLRTLYQRTEDYLREANDFFLYVRQRLKEDGLQENCLVLDEMSELFCYLLSFLCC